MMAEGEGESKKTLCKFDFKWPDNCYYDINMVMRRKLFFFSSTPALPSRFFHCLYSGFGTEVTSSLRVGVCVSVIVRKGERDMERDTSSDTINFCQSPLRFIIFAQSLHLSSSLPLLFCLSKNVCFSAPFPPSISSATAYSPPLHPLSCLLFLLFDSSFTPTTNFLSLAFCVPSFSVIPCSFSFVLCVAGH